MKWLSQAAAWLRTVNRFALLGCEWMTIGLVAAITVIVCAGGILPTPLLKKAGVEIETKYGTP